MVDWKLVMNRTLVPSGLLRYFEMHPWKLHKALQDYLSFQDFLQTETLWAFYEFSLPMNNPSKMLVSAFSLLRDYLSLSAQDALHCYLIWWAWGLQPAVISWQNLPVRFRNSLNMVIGAGEGQQRKYRQGRTPIEAILPSSLTIYVVPNFLLLFDRYKVCKCVS